MGVEGPGQDSCMFLTRISIISMAVFPFRVSPGAVDEETIWEQMTPSTKQLSVKSGTRQAKHFHPSPSKV
eukprot:5090365-Amphidinium_carterae.1